MSINKGDIIGIVGETGSGKSTFLDLLMGLLKADKGYILIDSKNIYANSVVSINDWRRSISHVPQSIYLTDDTISSNIAFGVSQKDIDLTRLHDACASAQILDFICSLPDGFNTIVGEFGVRLSGGQKQRLGIARALYHGTNLLILDEATSALDNTTEELLMKSILNVHQNMTIVMIAHRINSLSGCNRILQFHDGRLNELSPEEISSI